jgi:trigger factor
MKIQETLSQGLKREFDIHIPASEIEKTLHQQLEKIGKKVKLPGFRPGKVPLSILKQRYKAEALSETLEKCVNKSIDHMLKENNLRPALKPEVTLKSYEEDKDLEIAVQLEILPVIEEINLENLSFEHYAVAIPAERVVEAIEKIGKKTRETHPLKKPRKTKKEDIVIIDFEGSIEGKPIDGGSGKDFALELGSDSFIKGFEDQLIGHDKGDKVEVNVTFPEEYHEAQYANKPACFEVTIKDIHEAEPLKIDEELAKKLGFDSLDALKKQIESVIAREYEEHSYFNTKRHVLDALAERFTFDVPENMVNLEFKNIWRQLCRELGISDEDKASNENKKEEKAFKELTGKDEDELRREYKAIAERRVRLGLVLAEIGMRNKLAVTTAELSQALVAKAKEFPGHEKEVFDFYRTNEEALASLRAPLFENKVVDFILKNSKVTEKKISPDELEKLLSAEEEAAEKKIAQEAEKKYKQKTKAKPKPKE